VSNPVLFWGGIYSQWYRSPFEVDGVDYRTAEHFMMAGKARCFDDEAALEKILAERDPAKVKAIGRTIKGWDDDVWKRFRFQIVARGSYEKFLQNEDLREQLIETGDREIVEASPYDKIWGVGLGEDEARRWYEDAANSNHNFVCEGGIRHEVQVSWPGLNLLGKALMAARTLLTPQ